MIKYNRKVILEMLEKKYYDVSEAAKILNLSEYTVREKIRNKELKATREEGKRGRGYKIERERLSEYAQNNNITVSTAPKENGVSPDPSSVAAAILIGIGSVTSSLFGDKRKKNTKHANEIFDLSVKGIQDIIEANKYEIELLKLENSSVETQKKILEKMREIKTCEGMIKEIQINRKLAQYENPSTGKEPEVTQPDIEPNPVELDGEEVKAINPKYAENYSEQGLWKKIISSCKQVTEEFIRSAIQLFYVAQKTQCPASVKAAIFAALGYFILPFDLLPDFIPVMGFSDDIMMLGMAAGTLGAGKYIDDDVIAKTDAMMQLLGLNRKGEN